MYVDGIHITKSMKMFLNTGTILANDDPIPGDSMIHAIIRYGGDLVRPDCFASSYDKSYLYALWLNLSK